MSSLLTPSLFIAVLNVVVCCLFRCLLYCVATLSVVSQPGWTRARARLVPLSSGSKRNEEPDEDVIVDEVGDVITDDTVAVDAYQNLSADGRPKVTDARRPSEKLAVDPSKLKPHAVLNPSDTSMGVITVMGIECM